MPGSSSASVEYQKIFPIKYILECLAICSLFIGTLFATGCDWFAEEPPPPTLSMCEWPEITPTDRDVTYYQDVKPILDRACVSCHREGGVRKETLLTSYDEVAPKAALITLMTSKHIMPPWYALNSGCCGKYQQSLSLSDDELKILAAFAEQDAPEGTMEVGEPEGTQGILDEDVVTIALPNPFTPTPEEKDEYRCFYIDSGLQESTHLVAYETFPGDPKTVHHVILYGLQDESAEKSAVEREADDERLGYECFGGPGVEGHYNFLAGWAPGTGITTYPGQSGVPLKAGQKMVLQIHYFVEGEASPDETSIKLYTRSDVDKTGVMKIIGHGRTPLPKGEKEIVFQHYIEVKDLIGGTDSALLWGVFPHMHRYGTRLELTLVDKDGNSTCLHLLPSWDFDWQMFYFFEKAVQVTHEDTLWITCTYDTTSAQKDVAFGEGTQDEMCVVGLYGTG